jgi:hypothetical protein
VERCSLIYKLPSDYDPLTVRFYAVATIIKGAVIERASEVFAILRLELFTSSRRRTLRLSSNHQVYAAISSTTSAWSYTGASLAEENHALRALLLA